MLNHTVFKKLLNETSAKANDRIAAASSGDSHAVNTSYSYLLVYHELLMDKRPDIVLLQNDEMTQSYSSKNQALVIENEENFFSYKQMLPLLSTFIGQQLDLSNTDIVFGAGNQINKGLNSIYLDQYLTVLCAFDYDYGGLQIFKTLFNRLNSKVTFLMPQDFKPFYQYFVKLPDNQDKLLKALTLADQLRFSQLSQAIKNNSNRFMERESLLKHCS